MPLTLTVITWSMRHANLGRMAVQMGALAEATPGIKLRWHIAFNPLQLNYSNATKAASGVMDSVDELMGGVPDGWMLIVSDDNLMHPRLLGRLVELVAAHPSAKAFHFRASYRGGERPGLASELKYGHVDGGQVVIDAKYYRSFGWRYWQFPEEEEGGLFRKMKEASPEGTWVHVDELLAYHDAQA